MWHLENLHVAGKYLQQFPVEGKVRLSRVKYGGGVCHHIDLNTPIMIFGAERKSVILEHSDIERVWD